MSPCIACHRTNPPRRPHGCGPWCLPPLEQQPPRTDFSTVATLDGPARTIPATPEARLAALAAWADEHAPTSPYPQENTP